MMYGGKLVGFFLLFCSASPSRVDVCRFFSLAPVFFGTGDLWICLGYRVYILDSCHVVSKLIFTFFSWAPGRSHKSVFLPRSGMSAVRISESVCEPRDTLWKYQNLIQGKL